MNLVLITLRELQGRINRKNNNGNGTKKNFITDDDEVVLDSLKKLLILPGFEVAGTKNAKEAIPMIKTFKPHLILLDLLMPNLGGLEK